MTLNDLGYDSELDTYRKNQNLEDFEVGRVISEHKERYVVKTTEREFEAEIIGNLRYTASQRSDFPAVGDWVAISEYDDDKALIHAVLPRKTTLERQAVGKHGETQIIATNVDYAFIVQAVDRDFNINRMERYLNICNAAKVEPIILLNKTDLIDEDQLSHIQAQVRGRITDVAIIAISNETLQGIDEVQSMIKKGSTYCLLGSSGVGKSTLLNILSHQSIMKTSSISSNTHKGRHTTTHRELFVLDSGGIIIDNPGMREIGITESGEALETTFQQIVDLADNCKFRDCTHTVEVECAVLDAVSKGAMDKATYENYLKMKREQAFFQSTVAERRQKDKEFGKMYKNYKKIIKKNKE